MNLDIQHKHIKHNLIRTFAHACELLDRSDSPHQYDKRSDRKPLDLFSDLADRNADLLGRICDYRVTENPASAEPSLSPERLFHSVSQSQSAKDPATLRHDLREQLYQCLLFLELCEKEGSRCMLSFRDLPEVEVDACIVIQIMLDHMHAYLRRISAFSPGIAI